MSLTPPYATLVLDIDYYKKYKLVYDEEEMEYMIFEILYEIERYFNELENGVAFINKHYEINMIIGGQKDIDETMQVAYDLKSTLEVSSSIGIGEPFATVFIWDIILYYIFIMLNQTTTLTTTL